MRYLSRGPGYTMFVTPTAMVLSLRNDVEPRRQPGRLPREIPRKPAAAADLRVELVKARPDAQVEGQEGLPGTINSFIGNDPQRWRTNVTSFAKVLCRGVYPGIDLLYYGNQRQLEYDFVVAPGSDPRSIRLGFEGARSLRLDGEGNLIVSLSGGEVVQGAPRVYQRVGTTERPVRGRWILHGRKEAGFELGPYDTRQSLVIDPVLSYSTYLGGNDLDYGLALAVDAEGNAYVSGNTASSDFPTLNPYQADQSGEDVFVAKLSPSGDSLQYATYLGGSDDDSSSVIAVDGQGSAYVIGFTLSSDFPTVTPFQTYQGSYDVFVTKLTPSGSGLLYSTYLGGSSIDNATTIALDSQGSAYLAGSTLSTDFPTLNPFQTDRATFDAFVTKLSAAGNVLLYSTYLGGNGADSGSGIAVDSQGSAYVTGYTASTDFPTQSPYQTDQGGTDAFVTKLSPAGNTLAYSTYLGGGAVEEGIAIALDGQGSAYVTGYTSSPDFPTQDSYQPYQALRDAYVTKLQPAGNGLVYSTYLGGNGDDLGYGLAVDGQGSAYVIGHTVSTDFPLRAPFQGDQPARDAFVTKLVTPMNFFTLSPCRLIDTRAPTGSYGGPALAAGADRVFTLAAQCNIPPTARAVSVNIAVAAPSAAGHLRIYPTGTAVPTVSAINYSAGQTRSNNAFVTLNPSGAVSVRCVQASGTVHLVLDVNGFFQ